MPDVAAVMAILKRKQNSIPIHVLRGGLVKRRECGAAQGVKVKDWKGGVRINSGLWGFVDDLADSSHTLSLLLSLSVSPQTSSLVNTAKQAVGWLSFNLLYAFHHHRQATPLTLRTSVNRRVLPIRLLPSDFFDFCHSTSANRLSGKRQFN